MDAKLDAEGFPVPKCAWHPDRRPVAACVLCGRTVCETCATLGPEGYRCPECPPAGNGAQDRPMPVSADPVAAGARLLGLIGLVPLIGALGALAAIGLAVVALRRRRRGQPGPPVRPTASAPSPIITMVLGLLGLAGTVVVIWWLWHKG